MNKTRPVSVIFSICLCVIISLPVKCADNHSVLHGEVDEVQSTLKSSGIKLSTMNLPAQVIEVKLGSPAYYGGLSRNDKITSASIDRNHLRLIINRDGKTYSLSLTTSPTNLIQGSTRENSRDEQANLVTLSKRDIVLLIDSSSSMALPISRGETETKWEWCSQHVQNFATKIRPYVGGIELICFNDRYSKEFKCDPEKIEAIFKTIMPQGYTDLGTPLSDVLSSYLQGDRSKPLFVVVITDGIPTRGPNVEDSLIDASMHIASKDEIDVCFFQIGEESDTNLLFEYLDDYLTSDGAKFDIVNVISFEQLQRKDLIPSMIDCLDDKNIKCSVNASPERLRFLKKRIAMERMMLSKP